MKKVIFSRVLRGFTAGVALNCVICLFSSYWLKLGYYAPCIVSLTEPCGGELNAALVQACACGLIGSAAALLDAYGVEDVALGDLDLTPGLIERARAERGDAPLA